MWYMAMVWQQFDNIYLTIWKKKKIIYLRVWKIAFCICVWVLVWFKDG